MTREEAIQALNEIFDDSEFSRYESWYGTAMDMAIEALTERTGEWVESEIPNELYVCSNCGGACWSYDYERTIVKSNFCPYCGADMRGDTE